MDCVTVLHDFSIDINTHAYIVGMCYSNYINMLYGLNSTCYNYIIMTVDRRKDEV